MTQETVENHIRAQGDEISLGNIMNFLGTYHPVAQGSRSEVARLRENITRGAPRAEDVLRLANAVDGSPFLLRRGVVKELPGLCARLRKAAGERT